MDTGFEDDVFDQYDAYGQSELAQHAFDLPGDKKTEGWTFIPSRAKIYEIFKGTRSTYVSSIYKRRNRRGAKTQIELIRPHHP